MKEITYLLLEKGIDLAVETIEDIAEKSRWKNAAEDQRLEELKHVAVLGGEHD